MGKIPAIIVDIDGTIADISHRLHFIEGETKDWDGFYSNISEDKPIDNIISLLTTVYGFLRFEKCMYIGKIIFVTGRPERYGAVTDNWLRKYFFKIPDCKKSYELYMRKEGDFRQDYEIKKEIYWNEIKDKYDVKYVFEDRDQVVNMYRNELGLTVLQVANGSF